MVVKIGKGGIGGAIGILFGVGILTKYGLKPLMKSLKKLKWMKAVITGDRRYITKLAKHLEKEHPKTKGHIKLQK